MIAGLHPHPVDLHRALLDLPLTLIEHEAYNGHLKSFIVNHNVICIRREDAIDWLENRG